MFGTHEQRWHLRCNLGKQSIIIIYGKYRVYTFKPSLLKGNFQRIAIILLVTATVHMTRINPILQKYLLVSSHFIFYMQYNCKWNPFSIYLHPASGIISKRLCLFCQCKRIWLLQFLTKGRVRSLAGEFYLNMEDYYKLFLKVGQTFYWEQIQPKLSSVNK